MLTSPRHTQSNSWPSDGTGRIDLRRPSVARAKLHAVVAALPCTVATEACTGAHHWARLFVRPGHTVKLMVPKLVAPYRMGATRYHSLAQSSASGPTGPTQKCSSALHSHLLVLAQPGRAVVRQDRARRDRTRRVHFGSRSEEKAHPLHPQVQRAAQAREVEVFRSNRTNYA